LRAIGGIHVVAAQHQMFADGDAAQRLSFVDLNEREIQSTAAGIDHENQSHSRECGLKIVAMTRREIVERRLRLFDQRELFISRLPCRCDCQGTCDLVERCRHRDHDFQLFERCFRMTVIPCIADVEKQPRRGFDG
jgi:hypothetical protein